MLFVLDTNVLMSALRGRNRAPAQLLTAWKQQEIQLAFSPQLWAEIDRVLTYPKIQHLLKNAIPSAAAELEKLRVLTVQTRGLVTVNALHDDVSDNMVLACAKEAHADVIVSGDTKHLLPLRQFEGIPILSPAEAVELLERQTKRAA